MEVDVARIRPGDSYDLRTGRLAALRDAPSAFGSIAADEAARSDEEWTQRATLGSEGTARATFLARVDGEVIGLAGGYREPATPGVVELVSMWVAPRARPRGLARRRVETVVGWAGDTGAAEVHLWVTRGNVEAEALYATLGFSQTDDVQPLPSDPCRDEARMVLVL